MSWTRSVPLVATLALLTVAVTFAGETDTRTAPRPALQAEIGKVVEAIAQTNRGGTGDSIEGLAERLEQSAGGDRKALLFQLVIFIATHPGNESAMGTALLIDYYGFTDAEKLGGLTPQLDTEDGRLADTIWEVLGTVDDPPTTRESVARVKRLELLLMRTEPGDTTNALETVRDELDALSRDDLWWIRSFAARVVGARPEIGSPGAAERLRADPDPRVRQAVGG